LVGSAGSVNSWQWKIWATNSRKDIKKEKRFNLNRPKWQCKATLSWVVGAGKAGKGGKLGQKTLGAGHQEAGKNQKCTGEKRSRDRDTIVLAN